MKKLLAFLIVLCVSAITHADVNFVPGHGNPWLDCLSRSKTVRDSSANIKLIQSVKTRWQKLKLKTTAKWTVTIATTSQQHGRRWCVLSNIQIHKPGKVWVNVPIKGPNGRWLRNKQGKLLRKRIQKLVPTRFGNINIMSDLSASKHSAINQVSLKTLAFIKKVTLHRHTQFKFWGVFSHNSKSNRNMKHFLAHLLNRLNDSKLRKTLNHSDVSLYGTQKYWIKNNHLFTKISMTLYTKGVHFHKISVTAKKQLKGKRQVDIDRIHRLLLQEASKKATKKVIHFFNHHKATKIKLLIEKAQQKKRKLFKK